MNEETREWLGLTNADMLIYLSFILAIAGHFVSNIIIVSVLYIAGLISGIYSIKLGAPKKKGVSKLTNLIKKYVYHVCLVIVIIIMVSRLNYIGATTQVQTSVSDSGFNSYSNFGLSFNYPNNMRLSEQGLLDNTATEVSGLVIGTNEKDEVLLFGWLKSVSTIPLEQTLDGAFNGMKNAEGVLSVVEGELVEGEKDRNKMIYQYYTLTTKEKTFRGIYAGWYSKASQKLYQLNVMVLEDENLLPMFEMYLNSFRG